VTTVPGPAVTLEGSAPSVQWAGAIVMALMKQPP
jgi:hypothetical protein